MLTLTYNSYSSKCCMVDVPVAPECQIFQHLLEHVLRRKQRIHGVCLVKPPGSEVGMAHKLGMDRSSVGTSELRRRGLVRTYCEGILLWHGV